jgi:hypothetical protein
MILAKTREKEILSVCLHLDHSSVTTNNKDEIKARKDEYRDGLSSGLRAPVSGCLHSQHGIFWSICNS